MHWLKGYSLIFRYTPQSIELEHKLKPFIPDFIPAVGDIDAFVKVCVKLYMLETALSILSCLMLNIVRCKSD